MFRGLILGHYIPMASVVHRLDPRTKLLLTLGLTVSVFLVDDPVGYAVIAFIVALGTLGSRLHPRLVARTLKPLAWIMGATFVLNALFTPGEVIYRAWFVSVTREGLVNGVEMVARLGLLMACSGLLTLTTSPIALTDGLERLLAPLSVVGLPAHELAMMMSIALRFVPTLAEEASKIAAAQVSRGADFKSGGISRRIGTLVALLVPLFVSSFRRADELAMAMESRLYRGGKGRTRLVELRMTMLDAIAWAVVLPLVLYAVAVKR